MMESEATGYTAGIDLGTTYTAASINTGSGPEMFNLGTESAAAPSVMLRRPDGWLFGDAAADRASHDPISVARHFKRRIGDPTPVTVAGTQIGAEDLTAQFLNWVLGCITDRQGSEPTSITLTHPANWGEYRKDLFLAAAKTVTSIPISLMSEPMAAAINYASNENLTPGQIVCVYDLGGGTFDAALLRSTESGFETVGTPLGLATSGGIDLDDDLTRFIVTQALIDLSKLDEDDPVTASAYAEFRRQVTRAKQNLSSDTDTNVNVMLPGLSSQVRVTRADFESLARPRLERTVEVVSEVISRAGLSPADIDRVLLVGGSSRIPMVAQILGETLGRPVNVDADPKHAIALGAASQSVAALNVTGSTHSSGDPGQVPTGAPAQTNRSIPPTTNPVSPPKATADKPSKSTASLDPALSTTAINTDTAIDSNEVTEPGSRSRIIVLAGALVAVAVIVGLAIAFLGGNEAAQTTETSANPDTSLTTEPLPSSTNPVETSNATDDDESAAEPTAPAIDWTIEVTTQTGPEALGMLVVGDKIWVASLASDAITVVDFGDANAERTIDTESGPAYLADINGQVWVTNWHDNSVSVIDPETEALIQRIPVGVNPRSLLLVDGSVWVTNSGESSISVIDPVANTVTRTIETQEGPKALLEVQGRVWVTNSRNNTISAINPETGETEATIQTDQEPHTIIWVGDQIWLTNSSSDTIQIIDPESLEVVESVTTGSRPLWMIEADGRVWVANEKDNNVSIIDAGDRSVIETIQTGRQPDYLLPIGAEVWVSNFADGSISIIEPRTN